MDIVSVLGTLTVARSNQRRMIMANEALGGSGGLRTLVREWC